MPIKVRNIAPELKTWIMAQTSLGPGIGEIFYVAPVDSSTSHYRDALEGMGATTFYTSVSEAYAKTTANRNDIIMVAPGAYNETATIDWSKDNTHLIGLGGPVTKAAYDEANCVVYTDTTGIDYTIDLTGDNCQFINIGINNIGNLATNYAAMRVNGYANLFKNVTFIGNIGANQLSAAACGSLAISTNGHNCYFIDCTIGEDCWGARTGARSGQLIFSGSQPNGIRFINCYFRSQCSTATVAMVRITPIGVGRDVVFDGCHFNNYGTTNLNQCFASSVNDTTHSWTQIILKDCHSHGIDRWTDHSVDYIYGTMPIADDGGGQSLAMAHTVAGAG